MIICACCGKPKKPKNLDGLGTALKPAMELICLARKPLSEKTVAANVLKWSVGALNIDGCRVATDELKPHNNNNTPTLLQKGFEGNPKTIFTPSSLGRWPANIITDGSEEVVGAFPDSAGQQGNVLGSEDSKPGYSGGLGRRMDFYARHDSGTAARFYYTAKADSNDRIGSKHPTVKPLDLMQYLVRLICPKGGTVLDCFAGTGTTGEAAFREGMRAVLIEREAEYITDIRRRMALCLAGPDERAFATAKEKQRGKPVDHGPLFAPREEAE